MGRTRRPNLIDYAIGDSACAPLGTAGRGPNWNHGPRACHAGAARHCTMRHRRLWSHWPCTGRGSYASTHAHLCTAGRETFWGSRAASGPEELRDSERTYASTHAHLGNSGRGTRKGTVGCERAGGAA
jgi:hypothetical protein